MLKYLYSIPTLKRQFKLDESTLVLLDKQDGGKSISFALKTLSDTILKDASRSGKHGSHKAKGKPLAVTVKIVGVVEEPEVEDGLEDTAMIDAGELSDGSDMSDVAEVKQASFQETLSTIDTRVCHILLA